MPSGQVVQERVNGDGAVVFDILGSDATLDALDALELARIAEQALRELSIGTRCVRCGQFLTAIRTQMKIDRCAKCDKPRGRRA